MPPLPPINISSQPLSRCPSWTSSSLPPFKAATTGIEDDFSPTLAPLTVAISGVEGEGRREAYFSRFLDYANTRPYEGEHVAEQGRVESVNGHHKSRGMSLSHILSEGNGKRAEDESYDIDGRERGYSDGNDVVMANNDEPESSRFKSPAQTNIAQARWEDEADQSQLPATIGGEHPISTFTAINSTSPLTEPRAAGSDDTRIAMLISPSSSFATRSGSQGGLDNREDTTLLYRDKETMSETESDAEIYTRTPGTLGESFSEKGNRNTHLAYSGPGSFRAVPRLEDREPVSTARSGTDDDDDDGDEAMDPSVDRRDPSGKGHGVGGGDRRRGEGGDDAGRGHTWATQVVAR